MAVVARASKSPTPPSPHAGNTTSGERGGETGATATAVPGAKADRGARDDVDDDRAARRRRVAPWLTTTRPAPGGAGAAGSAAETELRMGKKEAVDGAGGAKSKMMTRGVKETGGVGGGGKGLEPPAGAVEAELARQRDPLWEYKQQVRTYCGGLAIVPVEYCLLPVQCW